MTQKRFFQGLARWLGSGSFMETFLALALVVTPIDILIRLWRSEEISVDVVLGAAVQSVFDTLLFCVLTFLIRWKETKKG